MHPTRGAIQALLDKVEGTEDISQEIMSVIDQWESSLKDAICCMEIDGLGDLHKLEDARDILCNLEDLMY